MTIDVAAWQALVAVVASFAAGGLIYATRGLHGAHIRRADTLSCIQAAHLTPTPRLGGVAILLGLFAALAMDEEPLNWRAVALFLSLAPLVCAGLAEDLGYPVRPVVRLMAAAVASVVAILLTGRWLVRLDAPVLDLAMALAPVAILVTVFATTAVSHAFNLVDGLNGLCIGVAITACVALAIISGQAGDAGASAMAQILCGAILGVLFWNYPDGKLFLGDTGAYALGHVLSWFAIALVWRIPDVSAWAMLLLFFWPLADTTLAIWRRLWRGQPLAAPDNRHMHHIVLSLIENCWLGPGRRKVANPLATLLMAPFFVAPAVAGVALWDSTFRSFAAFIVFAVLYATTYRALIWGIRRFRRREFGPAASAVDGEPVMGLR